MMLKVGLSGLSFAYYLRKHYDTKDFCVAFFGVFYVLSGFMAAYSWNIIWLDAIMVLPLIVWGLERLVREKRFGLYWISLVYCVFSNYYISIGICVFLTFYTVALLILDCKKTKMEYGITITQFFLFTLTAWGTATVTLVPAAYNRLSTASGTAALDTDVVSSLPLVEIVARHAGNTQARIGLNHWPNLYCGVAVSILLGLFVLGRNIRLKEKVVYSGMLLIFLLGFSFNRPETVWNGFHSPL